MRYLIFLFVLVFQTFDLFSLEKLKKPLNLTTSVIIPCHYKHAPFLEEALNAYSQQTVLPNEVVISLSECKKVSRKVINALLETKWPFTLKLLQHEEPVSEGGNRNRACGASTGKILICSDADDLPHWQRIEIIKYFFDHYNLDSLTHKHTADPSIWHDLNPANISYTIPNYPNEGGPHANAAISIARHVWERFKWDESFRLAIDAAYNGCVYWHYEKRMLINEPIFHYRSEFSTYNEMRQQAG